MRRFVKPNVLYSDVLKTPDYGKIAKDKNVELNSSGVESPKKSIMNHEMSKDKCVPHLCCDMNNNIENKF